MTTTPQKTERVARVPQLPEYKKRFFLPTSDAGNKLAKAIQTWNTTKLSATTKTKDARLTAVLRAEQEWTDSDPFKIVSTRNSRGLKYLGTQCIQAINHIDTPYTADAVEYEVSRRLTQVEQMLEGYREFYPHITEGTFPGPLEKEKRTVTNIYKALISSNNHKDHIERAMTKLHEDWSDSLYLRYENKKLSLTEYKAELQWNNTQLVAFKKSYGEGQKSLQAISTSSISTLATRLLKQADVQANGGRVIHRSVSLERFPKSIKVESDFVNKLYTGLGNSVTTDEIKTEALKKLYLDWDDYLIWSREDPDNKSVTKETYTRYKALNVANYEKYAPKGSPEPV